MPRHSHVTATSCDTLLTLKGVVQRFESYAFASKSYHDQQWYFCSIEPWLRGVVKPAHPSMWSEGKPPSSHDISHSKSRKS